MQLTDINPFIRFAEQITYNTEKNTVYVRDCRLFYILEGRAEITLDGQSVTLRKNALFYCCGGKIYTIKTAEPLSLLVLNFDLTQKSSHLDRPFTPEEIDTAKNNAPTDACHIQDSSFLNSFILLENCLELKEGMASIIQEHTLQKAFCREYCSAMLKALLAAMHRKALERPDRSSEVLNKVISYIASNYTKEIKNRELAALAGYHEYYLNRLFLQYTGSGMHKYILSMRINEARNLLLNTDLPLSHIAAAVGFNSNTHFSNYFSKKTGMTPSEYRKSFKNKI